MNVWLNSIALLSFDERLAEFNRLAEPRLFPDHQTDENHDHDEQRNLNILVGHLLIGHRISPLGQSICCIGPQPSRRRPGRHPTDDASGRGHYNAAHDAGLVNLNRALKFARRGCHSFYPAVDR